MKAVAVSNYRKDKYYPRVVRAVTSILSRSDEIAPIEVLMEMGNLSKANREAWLRGSVPYLERLFEGSLSKANRILRILGFHAHDLNMVPRQVNYSRRGRGKAAALRFSKSWCTAIEEAYSRHYVWNGSHEKKIKLKESKWESDGPNKPEVVQGGERRCAEGV